MNINYSSFLNDKFRNIPRVCNPDMLVPESNYLLNAIKMNLIILAFCVILSVIMLFMLANILYIFHGTNNLYANNIIDNYKIEWLIILLPLIIVYILIAWSMGSIYAIDQNHDADTFLTLIATQWKWSFTISDVSFVTENKILNNCNSKNLLENNINWVNLKDFLIY